MNNTFRLRSVPCTFREFPGTSFHPMAGHSSIAVFSPRHNTKARLHPETSLLVGNGVYKKWNRPRPRTLIVSLISAPILLSRRTMTSWIERSLYPRCIVPIRCTSVRCAFVQRWRSAIMLMWVLVDALFAWEMVEAGFGVCEFFCTKWVWKSTEMGC